MRQPDDAALVLDILLAASDAARLLEGETYDTYLDDLRLQLALVKLIEIIGEASAKLSLEARSSATNIPWIDIIAMRHRLVHDYREIDLLLVWQTAHEDLPMLAAELKRLYPDAS